jgi:methyl-accepting chemotaxis protein
MQLADKLTESGTAAARQLDASGEALAARLEAGLSALEARVVADGEALEASAPTLAQAIGGLEDQIPGAGRRAAADVDGAVDVRLSGVRERRRGPLDGLVDRLQGAAEAAEAAGAGLRDAAEGARRGGDAARAAAEDFRTAGQEVAVAARALARAAGRIEASNRALAGEVDRIAETAAEVARTTKTSLAAARDALKTEQAGVEVVLTRLREITEHLKEQGEAMEKIDQLLGKVLDRCNEDVQKALVLLAQHVKRPQAMLAPSLDTLREVVEQAEAFRPRGSGGTRCAPIAARGSPSRGNPPMSR